jgi:hypothetical protein
VLGILAQLYLWSNRPAEAEALIAQSKKDSNRESFPLYTLTIPLAEVELALRQGDYQRTLAESNSLIAQLRQYGMRSQIPKALYLQGQALLGLGQVEMARERLSQALAEAEIIGSRWMLWPILLALSSLTFEPGEAEHLYKQAQDTLKYIISHIADSELRASFVALPEVQVALEPIIKG